MEKFEVTVIILTYYHEQFLEKAIQSVLSQKTDFQFEILISDDASKDETLKIAEKYKKKYTEMISVHTYDNNVGTTQNLYDAFLRAKGKYITLLSGDDYYCNENKLMEQKKYLDAHDDCFAVAITMKSEYTDGEPTGITCPDSAYKGKDFSQFDFANGVNYPIHGIMIRNYFDRDDVRKQFHICVEFSRYIEDLTLCLLFFEYGNVHILPIIAYSLCVRKPNDENQHNFNSLYGGKQSAIMHVDLMVKLQQYFGTKISLDNRLSYPSWLVFCFGIKEHDASYFSHLRGVRMTCIIKGAFQWIKDIIKR